MSSEAQYVHGSTDDAEVARLVRQAAFVATFSLAGFTAPPGARVLDLGTGVGAMARELSQRFPGIALTAVDLSDAQLDRARALHPVATYVQADAARLPFPDASFDRIHASWLLEHVPDPSKVLAEARRVLAPGGLAHFIEVDNRTLGVSPPLPALHRAFDALNAAQRAAGGDPFIGERLRSLADGAGFRAVDARPVRLLGDDAHPALRDALHEEFAGICDSLDEALSADDAAHARDAAAQLRARGAGTSFEYWPVILRAWT